MGIREAVSRLMVTRKYIPVEDPADPNMRKVLKDPSGVAEALWAYTSTARLRAARGGLESGQNHSWGWWRPDNRYFQVLHRQRWHNDETINPLDDGVASAFGQYDQVAVSRTQDRCSRRRIAVLHARQGPFGRSTKAVGVMLQQGEDGRWFVDGAARIPLVKDSRLLTRRLDIPATPLDPRDQAVADTLTTAQQYVYVFAQAAQERITKGR